MRSHSNTLVLINKSSGPRKILLSIQIILNGGPLNLMNICSTFKQTQKTKAILPDADEIDQKLLLKTEREGVYSVMQLISDNDISTESSKSNIEASLNVLIVEDNPINRTILKKFLQKLDYIHDIDTASSGEAAVSVRHHHQFITSEFKHFN